MRDDSYLSTGMDRRRPAKDRWCLWTSDKREAWGNSFATALGDTSGRRRGSRAIHQLEIPQAIPDAARRPAD
jgi:hypothetical protein